MDGVSIEDSNTDRAGTSPAPTPASTPAQPIPHRYPTPAQLDQVLGDEGVGPQRSAGGAPNQLVPAVTRPGPEDVLGQP